MSLQVTHRGRGRLVLQRSRFKAALTAFLLIGFLLFWYTQVIGRSIEIRPINLLSNDLRDWVSLLALILPLGLLPHVYRDVRTAVFGQRWTFANQVLRRNGRVVMYFAEAREVELERRERPPDEHHDEPTDEYRFIICKKDGSTLVVDRSTDHPKILSLSKEVATILGVRVFYRHI